MRDKREKSQDRFTLRRIKNYMVNQEIIFNTEAELSKAGWESTEEGWKNPEIGVLEPGIQEVIADPRVAASIKNKIKKIKRGLEDVAHRDYLMHRGWQQSAANNIVWTAPFADKDKMLVKRTFRQAYKMQVRLDSKENKGE